MKDCGDFGLYSSFIRVQRIFVCDIFYPSFQGAKAGGFGIRSQVGQPESSRHMHDKADGVSVLDFRNPHAIYVPLWTGVHLFLLGVKTES